MQDSCNSELGNERKNFGSGLKRKRIEFVPAETSSHVTTTPETTRGRVLSERYLSITLKDARATPSPYRVGSASDVQDHKVAEAGDDLQESIICEICELPIHANIHDVSLAHQVCVEHSYPPSHLDRNRQGLRYLSSYGWDPDSRLGLGTSGAGIKVPIKMKVKHDTVGLGVKLPERGQRTDLATGKLNAKELRKLESMNKKRRNKLHETFYGNGDVEKYLNPS